MTNVPDLIAQIKALLDELSAALQPGTTAEPSITTAPIKDTVLAPNTQRAYDSQLRTFGKWCKAHNVSALPASPHTVAAWMAARATAGRKFGSITIGRAAINDQHLRAGLPSPTEHPIVLAMMADLAARLDTEPEQKTPIDEQMLAAVLARLQPGVSLTAKRDKALIIFGYASALPRTQLVGLNVEDLSFHAKGVEAKVGNRVVMVPAGHRLRPVEALRDWLDASGINSGPLFRPIRAGGHLQASRLSGFSASEIVKQHLGRAGFDATRFSSRSLRSGFAVAASDHGGDLVAIMAQLGVVDPNAIHRAVAKLKRTRDHPGNRFL